MQFNLSTSTFSDDIISNINRYCGYSDNVNGNLNIPLAEKVLLVNRALDKIWVKVSQSYNGWRFDDYNNTGSPEVYINSVANTQTYQLPPLADIFDVVGIDYLTQNSDPTSPSWLRILPTTLETLRTGVLSEKSLFNVASSSIIYYTLDKNEVVFYPGLNYNGVSNIRIIFNRGISYFTAADTTKEPGFFRNFHYIVALGGALEWAKSNSLEVVAILESQYQEGIADLISSYNKRYKDLYPITIQNLKGFSNNTFE